MDFGENISNEKHGLTSSHALSGSANGKHVHRLHLKKCTLTHVFLSHALQFCPARRRANLISHVPFNRICEPDPVFFCSSSVYETTRKFFPDTFPRHTYSPPAMSVAAGSSNQAQSLIAPTFIALSIIPAGPPSMVVE